MNSYLELSVDGSISPTQSTSVHNALSSILLNWGLLLGNSATEYVEI